MQRLFLETDRAALAHRFSDAIPRGVRKRAGHDARLSEARFETGAGLVFTMAELLFVPTVQAGARRPGAPALQVSRHPRCD